jgi:pimeloyl-ACP methyl ester carboxylesterase
VDRRATTVTSVENGTGNDAVRNGTGDRFGRSQCTTDDGVEIALTDFGGDGPDLLLVHATGFCASVLTPLAVTLSDSFHCWGIDLRAHGQSGRPSDGDFFWHGFAVDVLAAVDHLELDHPYGFGHSCGGAALLLAEEARPGTFSALYCFEPVVFPDDQPPSSSPDDGPLVAGALRRRDTFPSRIDAFVNFSSKPPLDHLDPSALTGYVNGGFEVVPNDEGGDGTQVRLRCRKEDEAAVYSQGFSHNAFAHLHEIGCPVALSCGEMTNSFGLPFLEQYAARLATSTVEVLDGLTHFGPLEHPEQVAQSVHDALVTAPGTPSP